MPIMHFTPAEIKEILKRDLEKNGYEVDLCRIEFQIEQKSYYEFSGVDIPVTRKDLPSD